MLLILFAFCHSKFNLCLKKDGCYLQTHLRVMLSRKICFNTQHRHRNTHLSWHFLFLLLQVPSTHIVLVFFLFKKLNQMCFKNLFMYVYAFKLNEIPETLKQNYNKTNINIKSNQQKVVEWSNMSLLQKNGFLLIGFPYIIWSQLVYSLATTLQHFAWKTW